MINLKKHLNLLLISLIALAGCSSDEAVKLISVSLSSDSVEAGVGSSITLTWSSTNADTCSANSDWSGIKATSGSEEVNINNEGNFTFTLSCSANNAIPGSASTLVTGVVNWPEYQVNQEQIDALDYIYGGKYGVYHNDTHNQFSQPYSTSEDYLNWGERGCPNSPRMIERDGIFYYDGTTTTHDALRCHGRYKSGEAPLDYFISHVDLLIDIMEDDGSFTYPFAVNHPNYGTIEINWVSGMTQGQILSAFARAYIETGDYKYVDAGNLAYSSLMTSINQGGTLYSLEDLDTTLKNYIFWPEWIYDKIPYTLNGYLFALMGIYDWSNINSDLQDQATSDFNSGVKTIENIIHYFDVGGYSTYDLGHLVYETDLYVVITYLPIHVYLLHALNSVIVSPVLQDYEFKWGAKLDDLNTEPRITSVSVSGSEVWPRRTQNVNFKRGENQKIVIKSAENTESEIEYKISLKFNGEWSLLKDYSITPNYDWLPEEEGDYILGVFIKTKDSTESYDNFRSIPIKIIN